MKNILNKEVKTTWASVIIAIIALIAFSAGMVAKDVWYGSVCMPQQQAISEDDANIPVPETISAFTSEGDFLAYLRESEQLGDAYGGGMLSRGGVLDMMSVAVPESAMMKSTDDEMSGSGTTVQRVSDTTVQVSGIDELDMVKTDGEYIYISEEYAYRYYPLMEAESLKMVAPQYPNSEDGRTAVVAAFPIENLSLKGVLQKGGELLLSENVLVVLGGKDIYGYDISDIRSASTDELWHIEIADTGRKVAARLYEGNIYLITQDMIDEHHPCPIVPLRVDGVPAEITCAAIYHPTDPTAVDTIFTAMIIDPATGTVASKNAFVGSANDSHVYMSDAGIIVSYFYQKSTFTFFLDFIETSFADIAPTWVREKLHKIASYDISEGSKMNEFDLIWSSYVRNLDEDEALRIENEFSNRVETYYASHKRDLERTGLIRMRTSDLSVVAHGNVPGYLLNQFAIDVYDGHVRVATTVGERSWFGWRWGSFTRDESANDVYVLGQDLSRVGAVTDLGELERIYAVRFMGETGYVVTFRETDPFYVLDLSNPTDPRVTGELKIPGYSSFLHPLDGYILGVGREDWKVKLSLFDVSDKTNPREVSKYILDESWSEAIDTHHAFLHDSDHGVFFIPGSKGGYVFSYANGKLSLKKAVSGVRTVRAIYINDHLYVIGMEEIVVLDENTWERVSSLDLDK
jgi:uncharacterized secreted protein with C-terminal beta-propeller domain